MQVYEKQDPLKAEELIRRLMTWYSQNQRDLIWRKTREPYRIWVCEIMAQQTRITAVLPYYERFMQQFPTLRDLARASEDEVLKAWEGLGYYSRARNLLKTARIVQADFGGRFPETAEQLKKLPGIGDYTAGAIASICFDQRTPAVDGNVQRLFARLYENRMDIGAPQSKKLLTAFIGAIMPEQGTGLFNQSLMEMGALVCLPKNPQCSTCPVRSICLAYANGTQLALPIKSPKKPPETEQKTVLVLVNDSGEILLRRRTEALLRGLWEFYMLDGTKTEQALRERLAEIGLLVKEAKPMGEATHIFTHKKWVMQGFRCQINGEAPEGYHFFSPAAMQELAMPTAIRFFRQAALAEEM